ncbi:hypothetical protein SAMN05192564_10762 [Paraburkholderia sartisoli]|uniref:Uncharacterized protein n=1 Tax=Paraburkholderia sartisoli TaxID=83784 RepID=A0A1H4H3I0_9BURK|nr:hypothetical protein SAMN05192564_10762 [Paraburkholderia sartisoli]
MYALRILIRQQKKSSYFAMGTHEGTRLCEITRLPVTLTPMQTRPIQRLHPVAPTPASGVVHACAMASALAHAVVQAKAKKQLLI